jgi:hypothetical protein
MGRRNDTAYEVVNLFFDRGVWPETALDLLLEWNDTKCDPPLDLDEIRQIVDSAPRSRLRPIGCEHPNNPQKASGLEPVEIDESKNPFRSAKAESKGEIADKEPKEEEKTLSGRFTPLIASEAAKMALTRATAPLIQGWIDRGMLSIVIGKPKSGKTFFILDWCYHIAKGVPWNGRDVYQGGVVYLAAESGAMFTRRLLALEKKYGSLEGVPLGVIRRPANLGTGKTDRDEIIAELRVWEAKHGKIELLVVDTLARVMGGGNENSAQDIGKVVETVDAIREALKVHALIVHHPGKDEAKGARGSTAIPGAVDSILQIKEGTLYALDQRDMECAPPVKFKRRTVALGMDEDGRPATSCVVDLVKWNPEIRVSLNAKMRERLDSLIKTVGARQPFGTRELENRVGWKKSSADRWLHELAEAGWVEKTKDGQWVAREYTEDGS